MNWDVFTVLDLLGTLAFAVSGASLAIKKEFDVFGVYVLAFVTSIGGGTVRDILIGNTPVEWMSNNAIIITIVIGASLTLIFNPIISKLNFFVYLFDAMGLGLFTMAGIQKALELEFSIFISIALGTISATFGGLIRDIITGEKPMLLTRKEIYALAGASGGILYFVWRHLGLPEEVNVPLTIVTVFLIRHLTHRFKVALPSVDENGKWKFKEH
ncbi:MAG: trimeric intracellular cation channel family protein [Salibacteraceae bacterium]|nr:trimeric intracellular cation channel family protein [Salibacteraceae bacterium]MDP4965579.1 trimeric intracellular cation channel family protein [Salibacteraceae bacterium]